MRRGEYEMRWPPGVRMHNEVGHGGEVVAQDGQGPGDVQPDQELHGCLVAGRLPGHLQRHIRRQLLLILRRSLNQPALNDLLGC